MTTDPYEDYDDESRELLSGLKMIDFDELQQRRNRNLLPPVAGNHTIAVNYKSFQERANEYAMSTPLGKNSLFYKEVKGLNEVKGNLINVEIDAQVLMEIIKKQTEKKSIFKYVSRDYQRVYSNNSREFLFQGKTIIVDAKINTLDGEIDFAYEPYFRFNINVKEQTTTYSLCYPFRVYTDSKDDNKLAIILNVSNGNDFEAVLSFLGKSLKEVSQKEILKGYTNAFAIAGANTEILDFIYETVPDFVLKQRTDALLYHDLKLLSEKRIDTWGTNENIAILNIINNIKNKKWFYEEINKNPEPVRALFKNFSESYIEKLIECFIKIGLDVWTDDDLKTALSYFLHFKDEDFDQDQFFDMRISYWTGYLEKEKKFEVGYTIHKYDKSPLPKESHTRTLGIVSAYAPLQVTIGKQIIFMPAVAGEYFTNQKLSEERRASLNNMLASALPEATLARIKPFLGLKLPKVKILNIKPSWMPERVIATKPKETVTLIGNFIKDTRKVLAEIDFPKSTNFGPKNGEFNLLNVPDEKIKNFSTFWEDFNRPWLDQATSRGDDVIVLSDRSDQKLLYKSTGEITGFGKEIKYMDDLVNKGIYKFVKEEGRYTKIKK
ncbi:MAG TPA: hypothetical protein VF677_12175 [Flavobacterium sp.]|jgi:hypothetical protein